MKKKIFLILAIMIAMIAGFRTPQADSRLQPYFQGEAASFNGHVVIGSVDSGQFEFFVLENNRIVLKNSLASDDKVHRRFTDLVFSEENGELFVYLINGRSLYKYRIAGLSTFDLIKKTKDNSWDYFYNLNRSDGYIITVGSRGVKTWDHDLRVIDSHKMYNAFGDNISFSRNGNYIFEINREEFRIIDSFYRVPVLAAAIRTRDDHPRHLFSDDVDGAVYMVDDYSLVKYFFNGEFLKFDHISEIGYDADGIIGSDYIYFSDGIGIVKMRKSDLYPVDWVYTANLGPGQGWSMGLRAVRDDEGEKVIVFNGDGILAFDSSLRLLDVYSGPEYSAPAPMSLSLGLDRSWGMPGSSVRLSGSGFGASEEILIKFGKNKYYADTDGNGNFTRVIEVPFLRRGVTDIKADGVNSKLTYSTTFEIK